jgi:hypothetical protein
MGAAVPGRGRVRLQELRGAATDEVPSISPAIQHPQALPMGHVRWNGGGGQGRGADDGVRRADLFAFVKAAGTR